MEKICEICGLNFSKPRLRSVFSWSSARFCSKKCRTKFFSGKNSHYYKGPKPTKKCVSCKQVFSKHKDSDNKKWEERKYCSFECYTTNNKGNKHHNWQGGISKIRKTERQIIMQTVEYKNWRKEVFKRDGFACRYCGKKGIKLNADHIFPFAYFPEQRFAVSNGQTLCEDCHKKTPNFGAKAKDYAEFDFCPTYLIA